MTHLVLTILTSLLVATPVMTGLVIIKDLSASGDRYKGGTITDPEDGKIYKAEVWSEADKLKVRGYLGPFYKTQTWTKAN